MKPTPTATLDARDNAGDPRPPASPFAGKRVYIAGPMTGLPDWNFPAFDSMARQLAALGALPINPADNFDGRTDLPWTTYLALAVYQVVTKADAVVFLPGWEKSKGARIEYLAARAAGLPLYAETRAPMFYPELDQIIGEAREKVLGDRNRDYGHPKEDFARQAEMAAQMGLEIRTDQVPLFMLCVKLSREFNAEKRDNLVDLAGYILTRRALYLPLDQFHTLGTIAGHELP